MAFSNGEERKRKEYLEDTDVYPGYLVTPNKKYIEHSLKYFSKMFSNERYTEMLDSLSRQIYEYYFDNLETYDEFAAKMAFMDSIARIIRKRKRWRFKLFPSGSTMTRLASRKSDLDVTFWCPDARPFFPNESDAAYHILRGIRHFLLTDDDFKSEIEELQYVEAKVPVLKIKTKAGIEADLSSCTDSFVSGIHNSFLIRGFVSWDERFAPLCMLVKDWASRNDVKNPKLGGFNSYAMVLLVVHFLQCGVSPPILPNLQKVYPDRYARNDGGTVRFPKALNFSDDSFSRDGFEVEKNRLNLAQLFILFLDYYCRFEFRTHYICMRDAKVKWRDGRDGSPPISEVISVFIHDPMDSHNPGRTVRDVASLQSKMRSTLELFTTSQRFPKLSDIFTAV